MGIGAHSVTSLVVEWYLRVEKAKKSQKITLRPNRSLQCQTHPKRPKQSQKVKPKILRPRTSKKKPNFTYLANGNPEAT